MKNFYSFMKGFVMPVLAGVVLYSTVPSQARESQKEGLVMLAGQQISQQEPIQYRTEDASLSDDSETILLAKMLFGEARACTRREKKEIANTALIRGNDDKGYNGIGLRDAVLKADKKGIHQYSCFNEKNFGKENLVLRELMNPEDYDAGKWRECLGVSEEAINGFSDDILKNGATHYYNPDAMPLVTKKVPVKVAVKTKDGKKKIVTKFKEMRYRATPSWAHSRKMKCLGRVEVGKVNGKPVYSKHVFYREK